MNEKQLKELLNKLDVASNEANVVRVALNQYVSIKQIKLAIASTITQYKLKELYDKLCKEGENNG